MRSTRRQFLTAATAFAVSNAVLSRTGFSQENPRNLIIVQEFDKPGVTLTNDDVKVSSSKDELWWAKI